MNNKFDQLVKNLVKSVTPTKAFKKFGFRLGVMALAGAALLTLSTGAKGQAGLPSNAALFLGNFGGTFVFAPADTSGLRFNVTADTIGRGSVLGNFTDRAQLLVQFPQPGSSQAIVLSGNGTMTTSDGKSTVNLSAMGTATPDPANPFIFNNNYQASITGGTGAFAGATGSANISEVIKFNSSFSGGIATLTFKGHVVTPPSGS
jgi:hypothetical protein